MVQLHVGASGSPNNGIRDATVRKRPPHAQSGTREGPRWWGGTSVPAATEVAIYTALCRNRLGHCDESRGTRGRPCHPLAKASRTPLCFMMSASQAPLSQLGQKTSRGSRRLRESECGRRVLNRSIVPRPMMFPDASGIGLPAFPQGSMDGSDFPRGRGFHHWPSGPSCVGRSGRGAARRGRVTAWGGTQVRMSEAARCASVPCVDCAARCGRRSCAGHRECRPRGTCRWSDAWAEAHRVTSPVADHAKHIRVLAVDGSPSASATGTVTPRVSAAFPVADRVLTELRSRQPRCGERIP